MAFLLLGFLLLLIFSLATLGGSLLFFLHLESTIRGGTKYGAYGWQGFLDDKRLGGYDF